MALNLPEKLSYIELFFESLDRAGPLEDSLPDISLKFDLTWTLCAFLFLRALLLRLQLYFIVWANNTDFCSSRENFCRFFACKK